MSSESTLLAIRILGEQQQPESRHNMQTDRNMQKYAQKSVKLIQGGLEAKIKSVKSHAPQNEQPSLKTFIL